MNGKAPMISTAPPFVLRPRRMNGGFFSRIHSLSVQWTGGGEWDNGESKGDCHGQTKTRCRRALVDSGKRFGGGGEILRRYSRPGACRSAGEHADVLLQARQSQHSSVPAQRSDQPYRSSRMAGCTTPSTSAQRCSTRRASFFTGSASKFTSRWITGPVVFSPAGNSSFSIRAAIELNCATPVGNKGMPTPTYEEIVAS